MTLVSVIMPTYNRQEFIAESIHSILSQTLTDLELIIVDDGSTDATQEVVSRIAASDKRISYKRLEHKGRSYARNFGLNLARGQFIAFQDSDDISMPERLEIQHELLASQPQLDITYCSTIYIDRNGERLNRDYIVQPTDNLYQAIIERNYAAIIPMTIMLRATLLKQVGGFDEILDRFEDLDFCLRAAQYGQSRAIVEPLLKARLHDDNAMPSQSPQEILRNLDTYAGNMRRYDNLQTDRRLLNASLAKLYLMYGINTARFFSIREYTPFFRRAFQLSPSIKKIVWFTLSFLGASKRVETLLLNAQKRRNKV